MKYRIKIVTYKSGRKAFFAQVKAIFVWIGIACDGEANIAYKGECSTRESALSNIDKHYAGNYNTQTIEFEYVQK